jgi:lipoxygenase homology domain-containing protein 1
VHVTTGDTRGAGTDADVHIALSGSQACSGIIRLPSTQEHFARGQRDSFRLEMIQLGALTQLLVGHNSRGRAPNWHLKMVEVVEEASGTSTFFAANRWLGPAAPDGLCEISLQASSTDPRSSPEHVRYAKCCTGCVPNPAWHC